MELRRVSTTHSGRPQVSVDISAPEQPEYGPDETLFEEFLVGVAEDSSFPWYENGTSVPGEPRQCGKSDQAPPPGNVHAIKTWFSKWAVPDPDLEGRRARVTGPEHHVFEKTGKQIIELTVGPAHYQFVALCTYRADEYGVGSSNVRYEAEILGPDKKRVGEFFTSGEAGHPRQMTVETKSRGVPKYWLRFRLEGATEGRIWELTLVAKLVSVPPLPGPRDRIEDRSGLPGDGETPTDIEVDPEQP